MAEKERLYTLDEAAELLHLTKVSLQLYRKRYGIGCIKPAPRIPKGKIHFSESDIAFIRSKLGKKGRKPKAKEPTEYEKFIASFDCRLLTAKELAAAMGICVARTDLLDMYAVVAPQKKSKSKGKTRKLLWRETDIPEMQKALQCCGKRGFFNRASGRKEANSPERIAEIKAKYANGVPAGEIEKWLGV